MSQNRIIIPAKYNLEITISVDTQTGQSEWRISKGQPLSLLYIAGIFSQHAAEMIKRIITSASGVLKTEPKPNGDVNNATQETNNH